MSKWPPHVTVASVIARESSYLLVEERDKTSGAMVFNQPAGHLEPGETLLEAALRETLEETAWQVSLQGVLGTALYTAPDNGVTYYRTTFLAAPITELENATLDPDIYQTHWFDYEAILQRSARMRSPLVIASIERHRRGILFPLDLIYG